MPFRHWSISNGQHGWSCPPGTDIWACLFLHDPSQPNLPHLLPTDPQALPFARNTVPGKLLLIIPISF